MDVAFPLKWGSSRLSFSLLLLVSKSNFPLFINAINSLPQSLLNWLMSLYQYKVFPKKLEIGFDLIPIDLESDLVENELLNMSAHVIRTS